MESSKIQQIFNWPQPRNIKALQSFLGFANFYCCFIENYSKKITSLTSLLKKDSPFIFNEEALSQFQILREASPILSHFNHSLPAIVETDGSDYSLGAVLKLLGIFWAVEHWRAFLLSLSNPFEVLTDHSSLQYLMSSKVLTRRLATLPDSLSHWDDVYPERGVDFISKNPQNFHQEIKQDGIKESRFFSIKVEIFSDLADKIQRELWQDKDYKEILKQPAEGESVTKYSLDPQAKLLLFKDRLVIPSNDEIQLNILQEHHDSPFAGHPGQEKTLKLIKRDFYWAGMDQFNKYYVS
ncbi:hypothetical protein O181_037301 [Austropuccinia psidii MF-1]|uniref:Integrase zinc-binding domain-containing protein n=1 Tax=Austropuccinia psidii MF-1 TaxID=1389203 RepID=A0A9Q3DBU4_9BASI|nr:hypothetical protein [Austropuccinia psidii MF-1]